MPALDGSSACSNPPPPCRAEQRRGPGQRIGTDHDHEVLGL